MDKDIMSITVENLAEKQKEFLKNHIVETLYSVAELIKKDKFEEVNKMLVYSPAGDAYGETNYYINFAYDGGESDLYSILYELEKLTKIIKEQKEASAKKRKMLG